jgi:hypothetical protein
LHYVSLNPRARGCYCQTFDFVLIDTQKYNYWLHLHTYGDCDKIISSKQIERSCRNVVFIKKAFLLPDQIETRLFADSRVSAGDDDGLAVEALRIIRA